MKTSWPGGHNEVINCLSAMPGRSRATYCKASAELLDLGHLVVELQHHPVEFQPLLAHYRIHAWSSFTRDRQAKFNNICLQTHRVIARKEENIQAGIPRPPQCTDTLYSTAFHLQKAKQRGINARSIQTQGLETPRSVQRVALPAAPKRVALPAAPKCSLVCCRARSIPWLKWEGGAKWKGVAF